jgi:hypothetical protein
LLVHRLHCPVPIVSGRYFQEIYVFWNVERDRGRGCRRDQSMARVFETGAGKSKSRRRLSQGTRDCEMAGRIQP